MKFFRGLLCKLIGHSLYVDKASVTWSYWIKKESGTYEHVYKEFDDSDFERCSRCSHVRFMSLPDIINDKPTYEVRT